jgi:hypothetical protein
MNATLLTEVPQGGAAGANSVRAGLRLVLRTTSG